MRYTDSMTTNAEKPTPKKTATKKITKIVSSRKGYPLEYKKKVAVRKVADCPYIVQNIKMPCEKVPKEMVCGTNSCWLIGLDLQNYEIDSLTESQAAEMMRMLILADRKAFTDWAQQNLKMSVLIV